MPVTQKLSEVVNEIEGTIRNRFAGRTFWVKAEVTDVKKYTDKRWCFLKFIEKTGNLVTAEIKGVFWSSTYSTIEYFESATRQTFASGLEITCNVAVKFHKRYGLTLEVLEIDYAYAIGKLELERKQTVDRLISEKIVIQDALTGAYYSYNNQLDLPIVMQRVALVTAPGSDGQRDFQKVIRDNKYGYAFSVTEFLTQIQGDNAGRLIIEKLQQIMAVKDQFDVVVIARGGGSDSDFKAFNDFDLVKWVALFPLPVLTGIGHDRNTSITDLVARQKRTPTEAATFIIDHNMDFDGAIEQMKERFFRAVAYKIERAVNDLENYRQRVKNLSPATILKKGFAIVMVDNKIVTGAGNLVEGAAIQTILKDSVIDSVVTKKTDHGNRLDL